MNDDQALFYPFHLCHEQTLQKLLNRYRVIHFMDYMALQLTHLSGTTAYHERMGEDYPELVETGRIVQGHQVGGPLGSDLVQSIDRDLQDSEWRAAFHRYLCEDRRFQRGLLDLSHGVKVGGTLVPGPAALLRLIDAGWITTPFSVDHIRSLSTSRQSTTAYACEYGFALLKTAASLRQTVRLCTLHGLHAVTDSLAHYHLLERTRTREHMTIRHTHLVREGY